MPSIRQSTWTGSKWIRRERRLAIYLRDGMACVWCRASIEQEGVILSLDHLRPHINGGTNDSANLVTACKRCNSSRGKRSVARFARTVAEYLGGSEDWQVVVKRVRASIKRRVRIDEAKEVIKRRNDNVQVLRQPI